ncbi:hypothetical protein [Hyphobacterium sp.]|uniref:hypothetical protein n=1 Tax=Hyphobacterium sp. TaxID=2004662 RepID=UPI003BA9E82D
MDRFLLIAVAGLFLTACATTSEESASAVPQQTASAAMPTSEMQDGATEAVDPDAEVCRRVRQTGTRFHTRICMTQAEWDNQHADAQEATRHMQRTIEPPCQVSGTC